ncbi:MAG: tetratricopeptide repeat protein [Mucispirillum sp.]|nr:tetratricopeptide repeat protein [Mucispirillum sp.]
MDKLQTGIELYLAGDLAKAIKTFSEYIEEGGWDEASARYHIGLCYNDMNNPAKAGENFMKAAELAPERSMYHYKLGLTYFRLMALDKAAQSLQKTIELNPEHKRALFLLGQIYFRQGSMKQAESAFSEVIEKSPDFADAYYYRYLALYHMGKRGEALNCLKKALEINPDYNDARLEISKIYFEQSDYEKASENCKIIYDKGDRNFSFIKFYLAVLLKYGDEDCLNTLKTEIRTLFPNNQELENLMEQ